MRLVLSDFKESSNMSLFRTASKSLAAILVLSSSAQALDFDWHGQFRAETNWLFGYSHGNLAPAVPPAGGSGYTIPMNGGSSASYQNLFLRLDPRVIVNDNVTLHSDLWFGTPDRGIFGGDQAGITSYYGTTNTGNASITANTFYADVATDFGTITVGRAPLQWGLGLIWNNDQDGFDRMPSTGDAIRMVTKLGAFRFMPGIVKYRNGTNFGGSSPSPAVACGGQGQNPCAPQTFDGGSGVSDYTLGLMYANDDEQLDLGILFLRRIAGNNAQVVNPFSLDTIGYSGYAYNVWDFYVKKKAGIFTISAEVPLVSGLVAGRDYTTVAGAAKIDAQLNDHWTVKLNAGSADGQESVAAGAAPGKLSAFFFHPDYRPGLIMFNYNLRNLSNGSASPYDNPVTNARFLSLGFDYNTGKWTHGLQGLYAMAAKTADGAAGSSYYNTLDRIYRTKNTADGQDKGLGFELDYNLGYQWDEAFRLGLSLGLYFPGKFYEFSNSATPNTNKTVFGSGLNLLVKF
jgi:hypothetical protein